MVSNEVGCRSRGFSARDGRGLWLVLNGQTAQDHWTLMPVLDDNEYQLSNDRVPTTNRGLGNVHHVLPVRPQRRNWQKTISHSVLGKPRGTPRLRAKVIYAMLCPSPTVR